MRKDIEFEVWVIADTVRENEDTLTELDAIVGDIKSPHCVPITRSSHQDIPGIYYRYISSSVSKTQITLLNIMNIKI